jgi:hypothetical protein
MRAARRHTANRRRAHRLAALIGLFVALNALAACSGAPADDGAGPAASQPSADDDDATTTGEDQKTASLPPDGKREQKIDADPKRLIGLDRGGLTALLGEPSFRRKDAPAEFWRYAGEGCMLDVFLYGPEKITSKDKALRVRHVAVRSLNDSRIGVSDCLRTILRARLTSSAG